MANLDPLIRLYKKTVDDKQTVLADLYREVETLEQKKQSIIDEIAHESEAMKEMDGIDTQSFFGPYVEGMRKKIDEIDDALAALEKKVEIAREDVRAAFAELKKAEITAERRAAEEAREIAKKEGDMLDEIGLDAFRRQQEEDE